MPSAHLVHFNVDTRPSRSLAVRIDTESEPRELTGDCLLVVVEAALGCAEKCAEGSQCRTLRHCHCHCDETEKMAKEDYDETCWGIILIVLSTVMRWFETTFLEVGL